MLANGKEVNSLMINGDVFIKDFALPRYYKFNNDSMAPSYAYSRNSNNKPVFTVETDTGDTKKVQLDKYQKTLVLQIIKLDNYTYCLAKGTVSYWTVVVSNDGTGSTQWKTENRLAWFRMEDFGGGTPIVENWGGK